MLITFMEEYTVNLHFILCRLYLMMPDLMESYDKEVANHRMGPEGMVDEDGVFHCPCGGSHGRGSVNGIDVYRCLKCGRTYLPCRDNGEEER